MKEKSVAFFERGSWYHRIKTLQDDYSVKYGKKGGFKTREEAEESYKINNEEFIKELTAHHLNIDKEVMLSDYLVYWFEYVFKDKEPEMTYQVGVAYVIYNCLVPILKNNDGEVDIKLKLANTDYFNSLLEVVSKITKSSGQKCREVLGVSLKDAYIDKYIVSNPITNTKKYYREKPKITILNKEQLKKLLKHSKNSSWYLEILLGVFCGLRKGEIMGLKLSDFELDNQLLRINRQLVNDPILADNPNAEKVKINKHVLVEKPPKKDSYRTLRIPKVIIQEVKKRIKKLEGFRYNQANFNEKEYVSFSGTGEIHAPNSLNGYLYKKCPQIGIPTISVHGLRHMFATILIERGVSIEKISALLGHSSTHTTFEIYCDIMDEKEKIIAFINNTFAPEEMEA